MNTARFCQFHDVWGNKWSFCSEKKEIGTTISSRILYWVLLPYEIDTGTLCLLQILQTRLVHSARWSGNPSNPVVIIRFAILTSSSDRGRSIIRVRWSGRYDNVTLSPLLLPARVTNRSHSTYGNSARSDSHRAVFCPNSVVSGWKN